MDEATSPVNQLLLESTSTRWRLPLLIALLAVSLGTAYLSARYPLLRLSALAIFFVIAIEALGGLRWAIPSAVFLTALFSAAEYLFGPPDVRHYAIANVLPRLVIFAAVIAIVEFSRRQSAALHESDRRRNELELERARGALKAADALYRSVGESIPYGVWHCNEEGRLVYMSPSFLELLGTDLAGVRKGSWFARMLQPDAARMQRAWDNRENWQGVWEDEYRVRSHDGTLHTILCRGSIVRDEHGKIAGWTGMNLDLTERSKAREQLRFLVEAGRLLSMSLDPVETLDRVAQLIVPRIADWCAIDVVDESGELRPAALRHVDASKIELARELRGYPLSSDDSDGVRSVIKTGESKLYERIDDELLTRAARDNHHLSLLRTVGMRSAMAVALRARDKILGVLTFVLAESGRTYGQDDLHFAEILGSRAALAYDNARSYAKEQRVADTFQRAVLPTELPKIPGIRLNATYVPGATESEVGGDWYDAFRLPDGRVAISIGDVAGKGLRAAVSMASIRPGLRGCLLEGLTPRLVLERVNQRLTFEGSGMVTAVCAIFDPVTLNFTYAGAGHPGPLLARPGKPVERLPTKGLPLGLFTEYGYCENTVSLEPGALLVMYTDGLVEFDHNVIVGEQALIDAVAGEAAMQTPDPSATIVRRVILGAPQDDVAVLTIAVAPQPINYVDLIATSAPMSARVMRQALRRYALSVGLSEARTTDLLTAAGEAISNVIEHAYGIEEGPLHVRASTQNNSITTIISDHGRWRPRQDNGSGRGLVLMRALMEKVEVDRGVHGTTVKLTMPLLEPTLDRPGDLSASTKQ